MGLLPENKQMEKDITPKVFFIWGQSMHGKTYLARQFPNPIILNTDGNGKKISTPHVEINDFETFVEALREIEDGKHGYQTVVIDLVDDIKTFLEEFVCKKYGVENIADIGFGKGYADVKSTWKRLMIRLTQLPYYVVFISHIIQLTDENNTNTTIEQPSLEQKYLNMTKGRTDVMIKCQKIGKTYLQTCNEKRDLYHKEDIKDKAILKAVENVRGLFEVDKQATPQPIAKKVLTKKPEAVVEPAEEKADDISTIGDDDLLQVTPSPKKSLLKKKEEE